MSVLVRSCVRGAFVLFSCFLCSHIFHIYICSAPGDRILPFAVWPSSGPMAGTAEWEMNEGPRTSSSFSSVRFAGRILTFEDTRIPLNTVEDGWKEALVPKSSSIRSAISIEHRLVTDRQTDRHRCWWGCTIHLHFSLSRVISSAAL